MQDPVEDRAGVAVRPDPAGRAASAGVMSWKNSVAGLGERGAAGTHCRRSARQAIGAGREVSMALSPR